MPADWWLGWVAAHRQLPTLSHDWCPGPQVTTRPEPFIVSRLSAFAPVVLAPDERRNREDVRAFIEGSLRRDGLTEEERAGAAAAIQERSEGVFAYVASVVRMVQEGGSLGKVTVGQLPTGHRALYTAYLDRQASDTVEPVAPGVWALSMPRALPPVTRASRTAPVRSLDRVRWARRSAAWCGAAFSRPSASPGSR